MAAISLFFGVMAVSAQDAAKTTDYSGKWVLDLTKSKLDERQRIESMTLTVSQTDKDIKTVSEVKRTPPPNNMTPGGGRGGMGGGLAGNGPETHTFTLDGKSTSEDVAAGGIPAPPLKLKAEIKKDGTIHTSLTRTFTGQMGEIEIVTRDSWSLSEDGKTLTINRDMSSPRGEFSSKMVFNKS